MNDLASRPVLFLAPHLSYPTRNGSDISIDRLGVFLSNHVPHVDIVAEKEIVRYSNGTESRREAFENSSRGRVVAGLRTIGFRSHFLLEKFVTRAYRAVACKFLHDPAYQVVLFSYITTADLAEETARGPASRVNSIWTHNDEFKWFQNMQKTANPVIRHVARRSEKWLHRFFQKHARDYLFLHVTETDREGFDQYYPEHHAGIVPIGVDIAPDIPKPLAPPIDPVRLLFLGSLSVKMNLDALRHFAARYEPLLRQRFGSGLEVHVAGSRPAETVIRMCHERDWTLHADVSDDELRRIYADIAFSLLPFDYATGAKLKLLHSLAHGVPFLATEYVGAQDHACVYPSLISDDPQAWADRLEEVRSRGLNTEDRVALRGIAEQHSWQVSARILRDRFNEVSAPGSK